MLPKVDTPIYELELISTKKRIQFRPFLVKEQKLLMMAQESAGTDKNAVINVVKQIINNCVISEIKIDDLPLFDIENIFLNLRARSISEVVDLNYRCMNEVEEGKKCNNVMKYDLNLLDIKPKISKEHDTRIEINEQLGMMMRYPKLNMFGEIDYTDENQILELIISCIDSIYDAETVYHTKDVSREEIVEFVDSLPTKIIDKIKKFFDTMPKISTDLNFDCNKCGHKETINLEGLDSFFV